MIKPLPNDGIFMLDHGISLPDYFRGSAGITLCTHVDNTTTKGEAIEAIESEFNQYEIHEPEQNYGVTETEIETFFQSWLADVKENNDLTELLDSSLEPTSEDSEGCYLYLSIEFNGETI